MLKAVLWDNDGVLVDTEHLYFVATRDVLATRGIELSEAQYLELFLQQSRGILHFAEEHGWTEDEFQLIRRERSALYSALLRENARVINGVEEVLATLHGRYTMGIVTSSQREHFDIIHAASGLLRYFDFVLAAGDYSHPKPHPAPYLKAVERAGVAKDACIVIEDSERGLAAARAAGLKCVIVPSRLTAGRPFTGAYRVLGDIREVLSLL
ncbi:MAG: HAD family phosphatase [Betaproteobacteria bacterium]|nr:HAD family phosphatase [Betaproteobacteria bacterium]